MTLIEQLKNVMEGKPDLNDDPLSRILSVGPNKVHISLVDEIGRFIRSEEGDVKNWTSIPASEYYHKSGGKKLLETIVKALDPENVAKPWPELEKVLQNKVWTEKKISTTINNLNKLLKMLGNSKPS